MIKLALEKVELFCSTWAGGSPSRQRLDTLDFYFGKFSVAQGAPLEKEKIALAIHLDPWKTNGVAPALCKALWLTNTQSAINMRELGRV